MCAPHHIEPPLRGAQHWPCLTRLRRTVTGLDPTQKRLDPSQQLPWIKRLFQIVFDP